MTTFYLGAVCLASLALLLALLPIAWLKRRVDLGVDRNETNLAVYHESLVDLQQTVPDDELQQALKNESARGLLEDNCSSKVRLPRIYSYQRWSILLVVLCVLLVSTLLYITLGHFSEAMIAKLSNQRAALQLQWRNVQETERQLLQQQWQALGQDLQQRLHDYLQRSPENIDMRMLSARTATELAQYTLAITQFQQVLVKEPRRTAAMAELAQALFLAAGNQMTDKASYWVAQALAHDANYTLALSLEGIAAFQVQDYLRAIQSWQQVIRQEGRQSPEAQALLPGIMTAYQRLAEKKTDNEASSQALPQLKVEVLLSEKVDVEPDAILFVYARQWQGGKMPLLMAQGPARSRQHVTLQPTQMLSLLDITTVKEVELVARLSNKGSATPQPGDWQAVMGPVNLWQAHHDTYVLKINQLLER